jgi:hypothetical protein
MGEDCVLIDCKCRPALANPPACGVGAEGEGKALSVRWSAYRLCAMIIIGPTKPPKILEKQMACRDSVRILASVEGGEERARRAWLAYEAYALPVMESASALTSARIDLLPHQVVFPRAMFPRQRGLAYRSRRPRGTSWRCRLRV